MIAAVLRTKALFEKINVITKKLGTNNSIYVYNRDSLLAIVNADGINWVNKDAKTSECMAVINTNYNYVVELNKLIKDATEK